MGGCATQPGRDLFSMVELIDNVANGAVLTSRGVDWTVRTRTLAVVGSAFLAIGCQSVVPPLPSDLLPESKWGQLAVVNDERHMDVLATGIIRIDQQCVYVDERRKEYTLVWPAERTRWVPPAGILFERLDGEVVEILNGHRYEVSGGVDAPAKWVNPPDTTCPEPQWIVADVAEPR